MNARCIDHLERYLRKCAVNGTAPVPPEAFRKDAVLICEDITCGVVPVSAEDRKWRGLTESRYLLGISKCGCRGDKSFLRIPAKEKSGQKSGKGGH